MLQRDGQKMSINPDEKDDSVFHCLLNEICPRIEKRNTTVREMQSMHRR